MRCVISPLLFVLVMEMILCSTEVNANKITGLSMKTFMEDLTLAAESSVAATPYYLLIDIIGRS